MILTTLTATATKPLGLKQKGSVLTEKSLIWFKLYLKMQFSFNLSEVLEKKLQTYPRYFEVCTVTILRVEYRNMYRIKDYRHMSNI